MEYFKFPDYLDFLPAFERALSTHTTAKGNSGIKIFGSNNNAQVYEMEIKIKFNLLLILKQKLKNQVIKEIDLMQEIEMDKMDLDLEVVEETNLEIKKKLK